MSNVEKLEAKYSPPNVNYWGDRCCRAEAENKRLLAALQRIDAINDNPAHYNQEINEVCDRILRPDLVGES